MISKIISLPFVIMIKLYQNILSPIMPHTCRFTPSCSQYMLEAIKIHGVFRGVFLGTKRLLKCHPWGGSGADPVPEKKDKNKRKD